MKQPEPDRLAKSTAEYRQAASVAQTIRELGKLISPVFTGSTSGTALPRLALMAAIASVIALGLTVGSILGFSATLQALVPPVVAGGAFKDVLALTTWLLQSGTAASLILLAISGGALGLWHTRQHSRQQRQAWLYAIGILYLLLINNAVGVELSYILSSLNTAFSTRGEAAASQAMIALISMIAIWLPISFGYTVASRSFENFWRSFMSESLLTGYLSNKRYYQISARITASGARIDNPDQRIAQDPEEFTSETSSLAIAFISNIVGGASFAIVLWSISHLAFGLIIGYAVAGTWLASLIGRKLLKLNYQQLEYNADFRYSLTQVRDNAESIAFYNGEKSEANKLKTSLRQAIDNKYTLIRNLAGLQTFNLGFEQIQGFLPFALLWVPFFKGDIELGQIVQASMAVGSVSAAFNFFAVNYNSILNALANASRLEELTKTLKDIDKNIETAGQPALKPDQVICSRGASLQVPHTDRNLVQKLDLEIQQTDRIMIVGPSGCGKTSLLRMVAGLWKPVEGQCRAKRFEEGVIFLPQRPYLFSATLSDLLHYPGTSRPLPYRDLQTLLEKVNLPKLLEQHPDLEQTIEWQRVLSVGEQQRIAFARILLSKAEFALLDEATSALDPDNERAVYQLLQQSGLGYMSIGHRPSLVNYHDHVLKLKPGGAWELIRARDYVFDEQASQA